MNQLFGVVESQDLVDDKFWYVRPSMAFDGLVKGTSIKKSLLTIGQKVEIIQCYSHGQPTVGWGFIESTFGTGSIFEVPSAMTNPIIAGHEAGAALLYLCNRAGKTKRKFKVAKIITVFSGYLNVQFWDSGATASLKITSDLSYADFIDGEDVLVQCWPEPVEMVIGWWQEGENNAPPIITGPSGVPGDPTSTLSMYENLLPVYTFTANELVTWSLSGGADISQFTIEPSTGALSFLLPPDFENPTDVSLDNIYYVTIMATDAELSTSEQSLAVTILDAFEPPINSGNHISGSLLGASLATISPNLQLLFTSEIGPGTIDFSFTGTIYYADSTTEIKTVTGTITSTNEKTFTGTISWAPSKAISTIAYASVELVLPAIVTDAQFPVTLTVYKTFIGSFTVFGMPNPPLGAFPQLTTV